MKSDPQISPITHRARRWRAVGLLLSAAAVTVFLMYGVENLRGWWTWKAQRDALLARGEKLAASDFFPPPVPDAENFALIPPLRPLFDLDTSPRATNRWRDPEAFRRSLAFLQFPKAWKNGPEIWPRDGHGNWMQGERVDLARFQGVFRHPGSLRTTRSELAQRYGLATAEKAPDAEPTPVDPSPFSFPPEPGSPAADTLAALDLLKDDFRTVEEGLRLGKCRFPIQYGEGYATLLPHLAVVKKMVMRFRLRAVARLAAGDRSGAIGDTESMLRLAECVKGEPFLISQLVRAAGIQYALQPIWEGVVTHAWTEPELAALQRRLVEVDLLADAHRSMQAERAGLIESLEGLATSAEERRRYPELVDGLQNISPSENQERLQLLKLYLALAPRGWTYASLAAEVDAMEPLIQFEPSRIGSLQSEWQRSMAAQPNSIRLFLHHRFLFANGGSIGINLASSCATLVRAQTSLHLAATALGLERQRLAKGAYPTSLDSLEPAFRPVIPAGRPALQPFHYEADGKDRFRLWTDGDDGANGGGSRIAGPEGSQTKDWVWAWPETSQPRP